MHKCSKWQYVRLCTYVYIQNLYLCALVSFAMCANGLMINNEDFYTLMERIKKGLFNILNIIKERLWLSALSLSLSLSYENLIWSQSESAWYLYLYAYTIDFKIRRCNFPFCEELMSPNLSISSTVHTCISITVHTFKYF